MSNFTAKLHTIFIKKLHRVRCSYPILLFFQFRQPIHRLRIDLCQADHVVHRNPFIFLMAKFDLVRETRSKSNRIRDRSGIGTASDHQGLAFCITRMRLINIHQSFDQWIICRDVDRLLMLACHHAYIITIQHAHQPGIEIGTKVLLPTLDKLFSHAVEAYNANAHKSLEVPSQQLPFTMESDVAQLRMLPLTADGDLVKVSPSNEIVNWQNGGSITLTADQNVIIGAFAFDLGNASLAAAMRLELFTNGKWRPVNLQPSAQGSSLICADPSIGDLKASKLRLTNVSGKALAVGFKRFEAKIL